MEEFGLTQELLKELRKAGDYSIEKVFHHLVKEPYNLPFSELRHLTPVVVKHVYFRDPERDEAGGGSMVPPGVAHRKQCEDAGMTEEQIQSSWQEKLSKDPALYDMHNF